MPNFHEVMPHQLRAAIAAYNKLNPGCVSEQTKGYMTAWIKTPKSGQATIIAKRYVYRRSEQNCLVPDLFELIPKADKDFEAAA